MLRMPPMFFCGVMLLLASLSASLFLLWLLTETGRVAPYITEGEEEEARTKGQRS